MQSSCTCTRKKGLQSRSHGVDNKRVPYPATELVLVRTRPAATNGTDLWITDAVPTSSLGSAAAPPYASVCRRRRPRWVCRPRDQGGSSGQFGFALSTPVAALASSLWRDNKRTDWLVGYLDWPEIDSSFNFIYGRDISTTFPRFGSPTGHKLFRQFLRRTFF
jgi:hypothetical protein